jgi:hypothetical protein
LNFCISRVSRISAGHLSIFVAMPQAVGMLRVLLRCCCPAFAPPSPPSNLALALASPGNLSAVPTSAFAPILVTVTGQDLGGGTNCAASGVVVTAGRWPWTILTCNASVLLVQSGVGGGGGLEVRQEAFRANHYATCVCSLICVFVFLLPPCAPCRAHRSQ